MRPLFPPAYAPVRVDAAADPFAAACAAPPVDGALHWSGRADRLDCAFTLVPEAPVEDALPVACVLMVAAGDALAALVSPGVVVHLRWPARILINGGVAGSLRAAWDDARIVLGLGLAIALDAGEPGRTPERTSLHEEGCGHIAAPDLLESLSRHFLSWLDRWNQDGFAPIAAAWAAREPGVALDAQRLAEALGSADAVP